MRKCFTMIELLAVVTISAIVVAMAAPSMKIDRAQAEQARIGGLVTFALSMHIKESKPVKITLEGNICKAEIINNDDSTSLLKMLKISGNVEAKLMRGDDQLNSITASRQGFGGGSEYIIKIRNKNTSEKPVIVRVNAFTGRASYYLRDGEVIEW